MVSIIRILCSVERVSKGRSLRKLEDKWALVCGGRAVEFSVEVMEGFEYFVGISCKGPVLLILKRVYLAPLQGICFSALAVSAKLSSNLVASTRSNRVLEGHFLCLAFRVAKVFFQLEDVHLSLFLDLGR